MLMFTAMHQNRHAIQKFGHELRQYNQKRGSGQTANQLIKSKQARNSFSTLTTEIRWLLPKVEKFRPEQWFTGVLLLVVRLLQTSILALVPNQLAQAAIMCLITLFAVTLQRELSPYRRASDNHVALLAQWLIFTWTFSLMLRIAGVFEKHVAATAIGVILCVATVSVFVVALVLANIDRLNEKRAEQSDSNKESAEQNSCDETGEKDPEEIEAGSSQQGCESPDGTSDEEKFEQEDAHASSALPWSSILSIGGSVLCGAGPADNTVSETAGNGADEATALMQQIGKLSKELATKDSKRVGELKTMISMMDELS